MKISDQYRKIRGNKLFHFTHENNVPLIFHHKKIYTSHNLNLMGIIPISMTDNVSKSIDRYHRYDRCVFLTFSKDHPLIYKKSIYEDMSLKYFSIDVSVLDIDGVLIADRVATDNNVNLMSPEDALKRLKINHCHGKRINCKKTWNEVKKYEILVPCNIDLSLYQI